MATLNETLDYLLKSILPAETSYTIDTQEENNLTILNISTSPEFTGQIIGKQGKTIKALRTLLSISHPQAHFIIKINS